MKYWLSFATCVEKCNFYRTEKFVACSWDGNRVDHNGDNATIATFLPVFSGLLMNWTGKWRTKP